MIEVKIVKDWDSKPETAIIAWDAVAEEDKLNFEKKEYNLIYVDGELVREEMQPMFHHMKPICVMPNEVFGKLKEVIQLPNSQINSEWYKELPLLTNDLIAKLQKEKREAENISAFAFNTGKEIEKIITTETNNLKETNNLLQGKIMQWYQMNNDPKFAEHFEIEKIEKGNVE